MSLPRIALISASVRNGRRSHRVALFLERQLREAGLATTDLIDLRAYDFPIFHERLSNLQEPPADLLGYAARIVQADGVVIVTPEYNGGYPPALKNAVDVLYQEWHRKPVAISTVSDGSFGGSQVLTSIQFSLWKIRAWTVPALFPVPKVAEQFSEDGIATDEAATTARAKKFLSELLWCVEAKRRMDQP